MFVLFTLCVRNSIDHSSANVDCICPFKLIGRMVENLQAGEVNHLEQGLPWASAAEVAASLESTWGRRLRLITQISSQQERNSVMFHYIKNTHLGAAGIWALKEGEDCAGPPPLGELGALPWMWWLQKQKGCWICHQCRQDRYGVMTAQFWGQKLGLEMVKMLAGQNCRAGWYYCISKKSFSGLIISLNY